MEKKTTIEITWANGETYNFDVYAMVKNRKEVFLIGFDYHNNQYTALGLKENEKNSTKEEHHVYFIKQQSEIHYEHIINSAIGSRVTLLSEVNGFWSESEFEKIAMTPNIIGKLSYFEDYFIITKVKEDMFLKHSHGYSHKKVDLIDYNIIN